jgi:hypothetical protein
MSDVEVAMLISELSPGFDRCNGINNFYQLPAQGLSAMPLSTNLLKFVVLCIVRDLGPAKAGSFAFVSPIIAVLAGVMAAGETVSPLSIAGMAVMLVAAGACLYSDVLDGLLARITSGGTSVRPAL